MTRLDDMTIRATPRVRWPRRVGRWLWNTLAVLGIVLPVGHLCFGVERMVTSSMAPTLLGGEQGRPDYVLIEKLSRHVSAPGRWEIVHLWFAESGMVAKRVVGLPGETVAIRDGSVVIDGQPLTPPASLSHLSYVAYGNVNEGNVYTVPAGSYYVLGDSNDSQDSRFEGAVASEQIQGRVVMRIWPIDRIAWLRP